MCLHRDNVVAVCGVEQMFHRFIITVECLEDEIQPRDGENAVDPVENMTKNQLSTGVLGTRINADKHTDTNAVCKRRVFEVDDDLVLTLFDQ